MRRSGFSLLELLIALVVAAVVASLLATLLVSSHRNVRVQFERADHDAVLRQAMALFQAEFRGLGGPDSTWSDIESMRSDAIVYKPVRTVRFLCRRPDTLNLNFTTWPTYYGVRDFRPDLDSVKVMFAGYEREEWHTADLLGVERSSCPFGEPGVLLRLSGLKGLEAVPDGAPLVGTETVEMRSYQDGRGEWWLGLRRYQKASRRWPSIQPVLGRLAPGGFELRYLGTDGSLVTNHTDVAGIRVRISLRNADPWTRWVDRQSTFEVAFRGRGSS